MHALSPRTAATLLAPLSLLLIMGALFWNLVQVFPYGILQMDTGGYIDAAQQFKLFSYSLYDWHRTIPFGMVLMGAMHFAEPSRMVIWINAGLFTINILLVYRLGWKLFASMFTGWLLAILLLFLEMAIPRTILYSVFILSDPVYANLLFCGTLLAFIGWLEDKRAPLLFSFVILGIAILMRPIGLVLIPVWILFAILPCHSAGKKFRWKLYLGSVLLLLTPVLLTSAHNFFLYGFFNTSGTSARGNLLPRVLPLLSDTDTVLPDPTENTAFIQSVRATEQAFGTGFNTYAWKSTAAVPGPFAFLAHATPVFRDKKHLSLPEHAVRPFHINALSMDIAKKIIIAHPMQYLTMVWQGYTELFVPQRFLSIDNPQVLRTFMQEAYAYGLTAAPYVRTQLYPPSGTIDLERIMERSPAGLLAFFRLPGMGLIRTMQREWWHWLMPHLLATACVILIAVSRNHRLSRILPTHTAAICTCMLVLFASVSVQYLLTSMMELPIERYAMPGEESLHLMILLGLFLFCSLLAPALRKAVIGHPE